MDGGHLRTRQHDDLARLDHIRKRCLSFVLRLNSSYAYLSIIQQAKKAFKYMIKLYNNVDFYGYFILYQLNTKIEYGGEESILVIYVTIW